MNRRAGFTLIELLITITIMVVLMTIAVISLRGNQASARDEKRKTDIDTIAQQLESYYKSGSDPVGTYPPGEYPPTDFLNSEANIKLALRDLDTKVLRAPDVSDSSSISFTMASSITEPTPDVNTYVYLPLTASGTLCQTAAQECRKFTIYYKLEGDATIQKETSKAQ
jgi:prepilin-type N-terminal cleavage/methylation domain-containing protein